MHDTEIIATCGCVCDLHASWNWVDESICDVEINIRIPCEYHRPTTLAPDKGQAASLKELQMEYGMLIEDLRNVQAWLGHGDVKKAHEYLESIIVSLEAA